MTDETESPALSPAPTAATSASASDPATKAQKDGKAAKGEKGSVPNAVWMGTAVGIGSAALVAALMYAKRRK
ncbi:hypothetical protein [Sphingobium sp. CR28]|uniref:hypothetical protein n=1 Tax=Sphingobium sp. CR28 TaxID=3400272 RepID=UPI003FEE6B39